MRILVLLLCLFSFLGCQKKELPKEMIFPVKVTKPTIKDIQLTESYVGHIAPFVQVEVQAQVEGVLTGYYFTEGQDVKAGDLLFTIDSRPYLAQLEKAEAGLALSTANLRYAEDVLTRNAPLAKDDFVSQIQFDQYTTNVLTNQAAIQENEADITTAKINISYCNIHSPIDAVTGKLKIQVGNLIKNAEETPMITLNQIQPIYAYFSVPQKDLPKIMKLHREGPLSLNTYLNGDPSTPYPGKLDLIDNEVDSQTGSILLRGVCPNEEKMLWPGEFIDVELITEEKKDAILVPTQAVSTGQKGKYLFVLRGNETVQLRWIKTGQQFGDMTLIEEGLEPQELVVTEGQINLSDKTRVEVKS